MDVKRAELIEKLVIVLCKAWNNAFRRVYNFPKFASTRFLYLENNCMLLKLLSDNSRLCFSYTVCKSNNKFITVLDC